MILITDPILWSALKEQKTLLEHTSSDKIRDVHDGHEYKRHSKILSEPNHISFVLNTDGVSLYKSSNVSIWPVWLVINELPKNLRLEIICSVAVLFTYSLIYADTVREI